MAKRKYNQAVEEAGYCIRIGRRPRHEPCFNYTETRHLLTEAIQVYFHRSEAVLAMQRMKEKGEIPKCSAVVKVRVSTAP